MKTPIERMVVCSVRIFVMFDANLFVPIHWSLVPHSRQNLSVACTACAHFGQFFVPVGTSILVPHSKQNLDVSGTLELHVGQITKAAAGAGTGCPLGIII